MTRKFLALSLLALAGVFATACSSSDDKSSAPTCQSTCERSNSVCNSGQDCASFCTQSEVPAGCTDQANTVYECVDGLSDADLCDVPSGSLIPVPTKCQSQANEVLDCVASQSAG